MVPCRELQILFYISCILQQRHPTVFQRCFGDICNCRFMCDILPCDYSYLESIESIKNS